MAELLRNILLSWDAVLMGCLKRIAVRRFLDFCRNTNFVAVIQMVSMFVTVVQRRAMYILMVRPSRLIEAMLLSSSRGTKRAKPAIEGDRNDACFVALP